MLPPATVCNACDTGHCGVGSVLGWNNARVAATLGVDVVLVANGGIGSTFDDLALNVLACRAEVYI